MGGSAGPETLRPTRASSSRTGGPVVTPAAQLAGTDAPRPRWESTGGSLGATCAAKSARLESSTRSPRPPRLTTWSLTDELGWQLPVSCELRRSGSLWSGGGGARVRDRKLRVLDSEPAATNLVGAGIAAVVSTACTEFAAESSELLSGPEGACWADQASRIEREIRPRGSAVLSASSRSAVMESPTRRHPSWIRLSRSKAGGSLRRECRDGGTAAG